MLMTTLIIALASLALVKAYQSGVLAPESARAKAAEASARACIAAGRTALPSWVDDDSRTDAFTEAMVAHLIHAGVAQDRIEAALTDSNFRTGVISMAAYLEAAGADYLEQTAAAGAFALKLVKLQTASAASTGSPRNKAPAPARSAATQSDARA